MTVVDALQSGLAGEYAIVYGYGVAGGHLRRAELAFATASLAVHQRRRDDLIALVEAARVTPVVAEVAYQLPFPVTDTASARRLANALENSGSGRAWDIVAASGAATAARALAVSWLADAAQRSLHWGALPPLPGQPV
jgi:hypothetical protein